MIKENDPPPSSFPPTMPENDDYSNVLPPLLDEYVLSTDVLADGEPVRCLCVATTTTPPTPRVELLSGSLGGVISRIVLPHPPCPSKGSESTDAGGGGDDGDEAMGDAEEVGPPTVLLDIQPGGADTRHPHQISAILSSRSSSSLIGGSSSSWYVYATGCRDGNVRVMDGNTHELKFVLVGHANAVTSLSWIDPPPRAYGDGDGDGESGDPWLVSGSWDGTARVWSVSGTDAGSCLCVLDGHENTVSVAGLPPEEGVGGARRVVTTSAGVADGTRIRGHAVRVWRLSTTANGGGGGGCAADMVVGSELVARVSDDHAGPIRDVAYDRDTDSVYTCSNDGTVKVRSAIDGTCVATLVHPGSSGSGGGGDPPILLSLCVVGDANTKAVVAGAEDGSVAIWDLSSSNRDTQIVSHPGCVWGVAPLLGHGTRPSSDFATACHDGRVRVFTRHPSRTAPDSVLSSFRDAVSKSQASRSSGPSPDEVAKLPRWEMNALTQGRSEGQVQVFQREGRAIAAQWSAASRTWIEVGEVTGTNANAGTVDGRRYDHVLPIEIDVAGGGVQTLKIGYNDGENPFVTAQAFIDEHTLDQGYLAQIADYIRQRAGETGPTLGAGGGGARAAPSAPAPPEATTPAFDHLPMRGYKVFDAGVDKKGLDKVLAKIREFNDAVPAGSKLAPGEAGDVLDALSATLSVTNRYHASTISDAELAVIRKMVTRWEAGRAFPALDLARATALHPDATGPSRRAYWEEVLRGALDTCSGLGDGLVGEVAVPMLTMRLIANSYRGGSGSADAAGILVDR